MQCQLMVTNTRQQVQYLHMYMLDTLVDCNYTTRASDMQYASEAVTEPFMRRSQLFLKMGCTR